MTDERESLESQKAEYEERLRGLRAYLSELKETAERHGTEESVIGEDLTEAEHNVQFYEDAVSHIEKQLAGGGKDEKDGRTAFYVYVDEAGEWRWNLRASNNLIIADSGGGYRDKDDCLRGINLVKGSADAPIKEKR